MGNQRILQTKSSHFFKTTLPSHDANSSVLVSKEIPSKQVEYSTKIATCCNAHELKSRRKLAVQSAFWRLTEVERSH
jgi:predicted  nucleic acid-binding Zn ribbon protein